MQIDLSRIFDDGALVRPDALPHILKWFDDYNDLLFEDFYPADPHEKRLSILEELIDAGSYCWFIEVNEEPAGLIYLNDWYRSEQKNHSCQIHGLIDQKYHHQGIARAIGNLIFSYLFNEIKVFRVEGWLDPGNLGMRHLAEKMGFRLEGIARCRKMVRGKPRHELIYGLIRPDYFRNQRKQYPQNMEKRHEQKKERNEGTQTTGA